VLSGSVNNPSNAAVEVLPEDVFPETQNSPPPPAVVPGDTHVPSAVPLNFGFPKQNVRLGPATVKPTTVPEARIDEDDQTSCLDSQVRSSNQFHVLAVSKAPSPECLTQQELDIGVSLAYARHDAAPGRSCDGVHRPFCSIVIGVQVLSVPN